VAEAVTMTMVRGGAPERTVLRRVASAAVLIPVFLWSVLGASPWVFRLIVFAAAAAAAWELLAMFERAGRSVYRHLGVVLAVAVTASFLVPGAPVPILAAAVAVTLSARLCVPRAGGGEPAALTLFALVYVAWLLGHALLLQGLPEGAALIVFLVGVTWVGESAAYLIGSLMGRHRLAPVISPRKTVEGSAAQVLASLAAAPPLAAWLLPAWPLLHAAVAGVLLGVVGQIGDLAESAIKRSVDAKDAGTLIPGHGGVLDRLDGLLFNAPALFYYTRLLGMGA
jgi:phosphatidate cytidylyltransferase